jgi:polyisoprenyl-teichoic acid--peptidoglycan teichoic acid transferase
MAQNSRVPLRRDRPRRQTLPSWLLGTFVAVFLGTTFFSAYLVFSGVRNFVSGWKITGSILATPAVAVAQLTAAPAGTGAPADTPAPGATPVPTVAVRSWTGTDRVTILVMGIDRRAGENEKGYLTDSIMVITLDPQTRTAALLSIPRDLWVEIPGYGLDTINTANRTGDYYDYPGGGPALATKTVEHNLGININYYVRLDFTAFETFIDTIGGVDIVNQADINDPEYPDGSYGYEPFTLSAGPHHLNGHDALRYARTRHGSTDIDRARRQQEVVMAVRDRILNLNMLPTLVAKAPALYQTLNQSVWTNLSLDQIVSLALLGESIPRANIQNAVIDYHYVLEYVTPAGRDVLVPLRDKIRTLRDQLFSDASVVQPVTGDDASLMKAEGAKVQVLNGSGVNDLACTTKDWLIQQGLNVVSCDTADRSDYTNTVIVDYTGKPYTVSWLKRTFGASTILSGNDPTSPVDIKVIVGSDWSVPTGQ